MSVPFDSLAELIRARRTNMLVDAERDVPVALIEQLCELALWAPNHKRTWPSRFALFTGDGRARLGTFVPQQCLWSDASPTPSRAPTMKTAMRLRRVFRT